MADVDALDVVLAFAAAPWWLGVPLMTAGVFTLGVAAGMWLR